MSTRLRQLWLRALAGAGVRSFVAKSGLGHRFVCHLGDLAGENPFYNREAFRAELELCASWLREESGPRVFDVGANVGFWSTHLAQMLHGNRAEIFSFEPVPQTLIKLQFAIDRLGLSEQVHVVPVAVRSRSGPVRLSYSARESLFAQVETEGLNRRVGDRIEYAASLTLDEFSSFIGVIPSLIKIDVEGSEVDVLKGAKQLLLRTDRPALMFEYNPQTLSEVGADKAAFAELLSGYSLHYADDFSGQRRPVGDSVQSIDEIDWVCNLFAVPNEEVALGRWLRILTGAKRRLCTEL